MKVFLVAVMCLSAGNLYGAPKLEKQVAELNKKIEKLEKLIGRLLESHPRATAQNQQIFPTSEVAQRQTYLGQPPQLRPTPPTPPAGVTNLDSQPQPPRGQYSPPILPPDYESSAPSGHHYPIPQPNAPTERGHSPRTVPFNPNAPLPKGWQRLNLNEQYYIFIVPVNSPRPETRIQ